MREPTGPKRVLPLRSEELKHSYQIPEIEVEGRVTFPHLQWEEEGQGMRSWDSKDWYPWPMWRHEEQEQEQEVVTIGWPLGSATLVVG